MSVEEERTEGKEKEKKRQKKRKRKKEQDEEEEKKEQMDIRVSTGRFFVVQGLEPRVVTAALCPI